MPVCVIQHVSVLFFSIDLQRTKTIDMYKITTDNESLIHVSRMNEQNMPGHVTAIQYLPYSRAVSIAEACEDADNYSVTDILNTAKALA